MNIRACFFMMISFGLVVLWCGKPILAGTTGLVLGTVADPTGAVVPGATVILRNSSNGLVRKTTTDVKGFYEFLDVPVGQGYSIEVEKAGFSKAERIGITLLVNQHYQASFSLVVGEEAQTVRVSATPAQVETTSTQLGDVIQSHQILSMPLNGRSYIDLLALQPGVVPVSSGANATSTTSGDLGTGALSVNGAREDNNEFMVNGGSVEHPFENGASIIPTLDSIQEFRVITNTFDAEYGDFSGGIVNVVTKSGTNVFHGDLYEFLRNQALDSRNFFDYNQVNPVTGASIPDSAIGRFQQNQFGGTLGGRLIRNKLFFFSDYQGTRLTEGLSTGLVEVPSIAERNGDFSTTNPFTGVVRGDNAPGHFAQTLSSDLGHPVQAGESYSTVFPGNVIPPGAITPAGKDLMQFIPLPTFSIGGVPSSKPLLRMNDSATISSDSAWILTPESGVPGQHTTPLTTPRLATPLAAAISRGSQRKIYLGSSRLILAIHTALGRLL